MHPQVSLILKTCQTAAATGIITQDDHFLQALTSYRDYFTALTTGREPASSDFPDPVDQLLDLLEDALADRMDLGLDDLLIPGEYPSLDRLSADSFTEMLDMIDEAREAGYTIQTWLADINQVISFDYRWLRDARRIRITPNPVRPLGERLLAPGSVGEFDPEEYEDQLARLVQDYPDHPLVVGELIQYSSDNKILRRVERHLRPLTDFPAGELGFYQDREYVSITMAHARVAAMNEDVDVLYECGEDLLRLGVPSDNLMMIGTAIAAIIIDNGNREGNITHMLVGPPARPSHPLASALVAESFSLVMEVGLGQLGLSESELTTMRMLSGLGDGESDSGPRTSAPEFLQAFGPIEPVASPADLLQVRVDLRGAKPPIWRRLTLPATTSMADLHRILQATFDWEGYHLHNFIYGRRFFGPADDQFSDAEPYHDIRLGDLLVEKNDSVTYWYDFGDDWHHAVKLEKVLPRKANQHHATCTAGRNAAPPEDCGGIWGYESYLEALKDGRKNEYYEDAVYALGKRFDPAAFSVEEINGRLSKVVIAD
ncbi:plasmid pRiA4b ORF-3 family protein [Neolewinella antarctica]|uniref:Plasmid pRiA4b Orf3-like domain-containing protein n=1 Tax=Neolewinella antarctica TaxID=442734 RepID=A0ABX0XGC8_9BACT|nr:plasmid pRiA4b ORF-3 family protein [Neolewinella antarctica]NJC28376.1 hypothetical protein [Neolewinella antarctica]